MHYSSRTKVVLINNQTVKTVDINAKTPTEKALKNFLQIQERQLHHTKQDLKEARSTIRILKNHIRLLEKPT